MLGSRFFRTLSMMSATVTNVTDTKTGEVIHKALTVQKNSALANIFKRNVINIKPTLGIQDSSNGDKIFGFNDPNLNEFNEPFFSIHNTKVKLDDKKAAHAVNQFILVPDQFSPDYPTLKKSALTSPEMQEKIQQFLQPGGLVDMILEAGKPDEPKNEVTTAPSLNRKPG